MRIQTFVFFDLETTGFIQKEAMPKITEIALVAVAREAICNGNKKSLPRILHKLILPVNPQKIIPSKVQYITKLYNEDMQQLKPFECKTYELITNFLHRLAPPLCFVAHNGNAFDYPIFLSELECVNKVIDSNILCVDTYKMFRDFFNERLNNVMPYSSDTTTVEDLLSDEYDELLVAQLEMMEKKAIDVQNISNVQKIPNKNECTTSLKHDADEKHDIHNQSLNSKQQTNEETPKSQIIKHQNICEGRPLKKNFNYKRRLDYGLPEQGCINLKLSSIYEYMFGTHFEDAHSAEADCLAMIRCVIQIADFFLEWSDNRALPLISYKKT